MAKARFKISLDEYELAYTLQNANKEAKNMLIMHGWGANKELMEQAFKDEFKDFNKLFIDLPGFGRSSLKKSLNSFEFTAVVEFFLNHINFKPDFIMGHSFGGKIAANLCLKDENIKLILLSNAGLLAKKSLKVRLKILSFKALKCLKIKALRDFFLSSDAKDLSEELKESFRKVVDENYEEIFLKLKNKTLLCWGEKDQATPLFLGEKMAILVKSSKLLVYEGDHFFFINHAKDLALKAKKYFGV